KSVTQKIFLHLAHRIARQLFDKDHALWQFEFGEPLCERLLHRLLVERGAGHVHDDRRDSFAKISMGQPNDGALGDASKRIDFAFHFLRVDVETSGNDQVLGAAYDMHIAAGVDLAEIAGDEKAVLTKFRRGLFKIAPIADKNVWPLDLD